MGLLLQLGACSTAQVSGRVAGDLRKGVAAQDDLELVRVGLPPYLLFVDSAILDDPDNSELLLQGASLYGSYGSVFVDEPERAQRMAARALSYASRAWCIEQPQLCDAEHMPYDEWLAALQTLGEGQLPLIYGYAVAWAGMVAVDSGDWGRLAQLPKVEALLERVIALDEGYDKGRAHLYLAVMRSQLPPAMGGRPEQGREHFERALELSQRQDLLVHVEYARNYARLVFDRQLHDSLLHEVLDSQVEDPSYTLTNTVARLRAQALLDDGADYFLE